MGILLLMPNPPITPAWLSLPAASTYSGLSVRLLQDLIRRNLIVSSAVKQPGAKRGRRLISRSSLDEWIERGIGGTCELPFTG
jgi:hypothetical protein